jgi:protein-disulfide isomerase
MNKTSRSTINEHRSQRRRKEQAKSIGLIIIGVLVLFGAGILHKVASENAVNVLVPEDRQHPMADGNALGDPNAPVKVEVYSSFGCGHCYNFYTESEQLFIQNYVETGLVYYVYQPFDGDPTSIYTIASNAALCAGDQEKFWEMHDILFANIGTRYVQSNIDQMAEEIGLDMETYNACMESNRYIDQIIQSTENAALEMGITGTPTFVVNGEIGMVGNEGYQTLAAVVEQALSAVSDQ